MLHIHCGDSSAATLRRSGVPGAAIVWALVVGCRRATAQPPVIPARIPLRAHLGSQGNRATLVPSAPGLTHGWGGIGAQLGGAGRSVARAASAK